MMIEKIEAEIQNLKLRLTEILTRKLAVDNDLEGANSQLLRLCEQQSEAKLRALNPGESVVAMYAFEIPKRVFAKIGKPLSDTTVEASIVAHLEKVCLVCVDGIEFKMKYDALRHPDETIPASRAAAIRRELEETLKKRKRR